MSALKKANKGAVFWAYSSSYYDAVVSRVITRHSITYDIFLYCWRKKDSNTVVFFRARDMQRHTIIRKRTETWNISSLLHFSFLQTFLCGIAENSSSFALLCSSASSSSESCDRWAKLRCGYCIFLVKYMFSLSCLYLGPLSPKPSQGDGLLFMASIMFLFLPRALSALSAFSLCNKKTSCYPTETFITTASKQKAHFHYPKRLLERK